MSMDEVQLCHVSVSAKNAKRAVIVGVTAPLKFEPAVLKQLLTEAVSYNTVKAIVDVRNTGYSTFDITFVPDTSALAEVGLEAVEKHLLIIYRRIVAETKQVLYQDRLRAAVGR